MNKQRAIEWMEELRSGEHVQARGLLHMADGSKCCLGVACSLVPGLTRVLTGERFEYDGDGTSLPKAAREYFDIQDNSGTLQADYIIINGHEYGTLAEANDSGCTFAQIADWIEQNWGRL